MVKILHLWGDSARKCLWPENGGDFSRIVVVARVSLTFSAGTVSEEKCSWDPITGAISLVVKGLHLWGKSASGPIRVTMSSDLKVAATRPENRL